MGSAGLRTAAPPAIVTRPEREAEHWVDALSRKGLAAEALPLIVIDPPPDVAPVHAAWQRLAQCHAVMFVSANAVAQFFAARPAAFAWGRLQAWATGPGTSLALQRAGVAEQAIAAPPADAARFDSEALWATLDGAPLAGQRVLIVRGADDAGHLAGRPWLADRLEEAGATVEQVVAYQRSLPAWGGEQRGRARRAARDGSVWVFSSSDALRHLSALLPQEDWRAARAVATHVRIAQAALALGFGHVLASSPRLADVVASIESVQ